MPRGRPRAFNVERALDRALKVFWRTGYEGASLDDLTRAMGISRPSLYAAFGNKEALFRRALDRYETGPACHVGQALQAPTARQVVERLFAGSIKLTTQPGHPRGCLLVQSALVCGDDADPTRREVQKRRIAVETALRERFLRAKRERDLPAKANAADLARFVTAVSHGLAVQAAGGATREQLKRAAEIALAAWPT